MRKALSELELKTDQKTARGQQVATRLHKAQMNTVRVLKNEERKIWLALISSKEKDWICKDERERLGRDFQEQHTRMSGSMDGLLK